MTHQIFPQDHQLAQKYRLGIPTRKFYLDPPSSILPAVIPVQLPICAFGLLGCSVFVFSLWFNVSFSSSPGLTWAWFYILLVSAVPVVPGFFFCLHGRNVLFFLNLIGCVCSFFLLLLFSNILFFLRVSHLAQTQFFFGFFCQLLSWILLECALYLVPLPSSLLICTDGCLFTNRLGWHKAIRWDQVVSVQMSKNCTSIVCCNGMTLNLYGSWMKSTAIQQLIHGKTSLQLYSRAQAAYHAGEAVIFGRFIINKQGINNGRQLFPWSQLRSCEYVESGLALISKDDTCLDLAYLSLLPNATIFVKLVNSILDTD